MRILFIDDSDDMRSMMALLLDRQGYEVKTADSAAEALRVAPAWRPHLIVSDIGMPGIDGYDLMRRLRSDTRLAPFRSVALSGFANPAESGDGSRAGFDQCLTKPVDFDVLFAALRSLEMTLSPEALTGAGAGLQDVADPEFGHSFAPNC